MKVARPGADLLELGREAEVDRHLLPLPHGRPLLGERRRTLLGVLRAEHRHEQRLLVAPGIASVRPWVPLMICLLAATASGALRAMRSASCSAPSTASPGAVTLATRPHSCACGAVIGSAVSASSIARIRPIRDGSRSSAPPPANRPTPASGMPILTFSAATRRSQASASSSPPARAKPSMAATSGLLGALGEELDHPLRACPRRRTP